MLNRSTFTGPMIWSTIAISLCVIFVLAGVAPILGAAFASGIGDKRPSEFLARLERAHERSLDTDMARVNGRNLFYVTQKTPKQRPPPPPPPPPPTTGDEPEDTGPPPPQPPPATYRGPGIIAVMGEAVWFRPVRAGSKPLIVRTDEEKDGITVIATTPPWSARLGHDGGEYDVSLLNRVIPGLVTTASLDAAAPGLIPVASTPPEDPPAPGTPGEIAVEGAATDRRGEANEKEVESAGAAPADDVLAARNREPSDEGDPDHGDGRPRPAVPRPTPPRPEVN